MKASEGSEDVRIFKLSLRIFQDKKLKLTEAATQRCSQEKIFRKYAANLQENPHAEVWFE